MRTITLPVYTFEELSNNVQEKLVNDYIESYSFDSEYSQQLDFLEDIIRLFATKYPSLVLNADGYDEVGRTISLSHNADLGDFITKDLISDFHQLLIDYGYYYSEILLAEFTDNLNAFDASNTQDDVIVFLNKIFSYLHSTFQEENLEAVDYSNVKSTYFENCPDLEYFKDGTIFNPELLEE